MEYRIIKKQIKIFQMIKFKSSNSLQHIKGNISLEIVYQFNCHSGAT